MIIVRESIVHNRAASQRRVKFICFKESDRPTKQGKGSTQVLLEDWLVKVALSIHVRGECVDFVTLKNISSAWFTTNACDRLAKDAFLIELEEVLCVSLEVPCPHPDFSGLVRQLEQLDFELVVWVTDGLYGVALSIDKFSLAWKWHPRINHFDLVFAIVLVIKNAALNAPYKPFLLLIRATLKGILGLVYHLDNSKLINQ